MSARAASGGIEIHPGARIGRRFFVDHGCGVVIGETCVIGDDVTLFHQVTLGSTGWWNDAKRGPGARRHPELRDGVTVGCAAAILGPVVVGEGSTIGALALVLADVAPRSVVYAPRAAVLEAGGERLRLAASPQEPSTAAALPTAIGANR
jgi:serine O-acetyltransferase